METFCWSWNALNLWEVFNAVHLPFEISSMRGWFKKCTLWSPQHVMLGWQMSHGTCKSTLALMELVTSWAPKTREMKGFERVFLPWQQSVDNVQIIFTPNTSEGLPAMPPSIEEKGLSQIWHKSTVQHPAIRNQRFDICKFTSGQCWKLRCCCWGMHHNHAVQGKSATRTTACKWN